MDTASTEQVTDFSPRHPNKPQHTRPFTSPPVRQDVLGFDDGDVAAELAHVRAKDLFAANIASDWAQLKRLIDEHGFPPGILLSPNVRVFAVRDVKRWLATRPVTDTSKDA